MEEEVAFPGAQTNENNKKQKTVKRNSLAVEIFCFLEVFARNLHTHTPSRNESHTHTRTHARTKVHKSRQRNETGTLPACAMSLC